MQNRGRIVISILITVITAITFVLGSMMYHSNLKQTKQNTIGVELADFIYNIDYSMQFGKQIETFYGMNEMIKSEKDAFLDINDLYIVSKDNKILFTTDYTDPAPQICSLSAGENITDGDSLYCMYELSENSRVMVRTSQKGINEETLEYIKNLAIKAAIGLAITILLILLFAFSVKKEKVASALSAVSLIIWIVLFGAMIGGDGYNSYKDSLNTVYDSIEYSINQDFDKMESLGVQKNQINDVDNYLKRYTDMVSEVDDIKIDGDKITCVSSDSYGQKVLLDYVFQTVLLLTFSLLIFTEYKIFSKNGQITDKAVRDETN